VSFLAKNLSYTVLKHFDFLVVRFLLGKLVLSCKHLNLFAKHATHATFSSLARKQIINSIIHFLHVYLASLMVLLKPCELPLPYNVNVFVCSPFNYHLLTSNCFNYVCGRSNFVYLSFRKVLEERNALEKFDFFSFKNGVVNGKAVFILLQVQSRKVAFGSTHDPC